MSGLPPFLTNNHSHKICLILEGYEEYIYFDKILKFPCFRSDLYDVKPINAKTASNVPIIYQDELMKNIHELVLVVCDKDRVPTEYNGIINKLDLIHGAGKGHYVVTFTCPCTLQVILSHFGDVSLKTQAKKAARSIVSDLTGVEGYDAHQEQLKEICNKIHYRTYNEMKMRIGQISTSPDDIPSTNMLELLCNLESEDDSWIAKINQLLLSDD